MGGCSSRAEDLIGACWMGCGEGSWDWEVSVCVEWFGESPGCGDSVRFRFLFLFGGVAGIGLRRLLPIDTLLGTLGFGVISTAAATVTATHTAPTSALAPAPASASASALAVVVVVVVVVVLTS